MRVVVVGGGFAGLAAAIALQERRHEVTLLERRGVLGGRATSYRDAASGEDVDNGTHVMIGAYAETLDLLRRAGASELLLVQDDLHIDYVDDAGPSRLSCPPLPAPLHLLLGLLGMRLGWRSRWQALRLALAVRFAKRPVDLSLVHYLEMHAQGEEVCQRLWEPLATAILNETPERAAAVLFHEVFKQAFLKNRRASRLVFLRRGYGAVHERLAAYFEARGGRIRRRALADDVEIDSGGVSAVWVQQRPLSRDEIASGASPVMERFGADAVVLAVPWHALRALVPEPFRETEPFSAAARLESSPIVSLELWLDRVVVDKPMIGLADGELQWVFDKGRLFGRAGAPQHLAFIVSAAVRSLDRSNAELRAAALEALLRYFPAMKEATIQRALVLREPDATFVCSPEAERLRPGPLTPVPGLFLAGDWTNTGLPPTIEGAVRSGRAAAAAVEARR
jgi:squalene-associated FAD-dependent desaturase